MCIWFWIFVIFWLIGSITIILLDAYEKRDRKTGKLVFLRGFRKETHPKFSDWCKLVFAILLSWILLVIVLFEEVR